MKEAAIWKSQAGKNAVLEYYDSVLDRWPAPYEQLTIPTRLGATAAIACGDPAAPALILLHGSSSNATMWIGDVAEYSRHFRVYALDIPGEPGKSDPARPDLAGPAYAEWLADILKHLGLDEIYLVGISLGGFMALKFACAYPERVARMGLLCPSGVAPSRVSFLWKALPLMVLGRWGQERLFRIVSGNTELAREAVDYSLLIANQFRPRLQVPLLSDDELKHVTMPVLLIAGGQDALLPSFKTAARLAQWLSCLQTTILPDRGHVLVGQATPIKRFLLTASPG